MSIVVTFASLIWFISYESIEFPNHCDYANFCLWAIIPAPVILLLINSIILLIRYFTIKRRIHKLYNNEIDGLHDFEAREQPIEKPKKKFRFKKYDSENN